MAPNPEVTLDDLYTALCELRTSVNRTESADISSTWRATMQSEMANLRTQMISLTQAVDRSCNKETKRDTCPFRDDIVLAANNRARLAATENAIYELKLAMARAGILSGAAGGGIVTVVAGIVYGIGHQAGWW